MSALNHGFDRAALKGKVALITGASSGIGAQQARALASVGASLVLLARSGEALEALADALKQAHPEANVATLAVDLLQVESWQALASRARDAHGDIDILCNTAGINQRKALEDVTEADWALTLDLNLKVPFMLARALVPAMRERGWGKVINVGSLQSSRAFANSLPYGAAKGGVAQMTRAMAEAWGRYGIGCNAIAPGFFKTPLTEAVFSDQALASKLAQQTALGRNGVLEDIEGPTLFLASHASDYVAGQMLFVDGGFTAK